MTEDHVTGIVTVGVVLALYFLPWIIANHRHHPQQTPIFALNLLLGWTLIGWVIAIVWALTAFSAPKRPASYAQLSPEERLPCPFCAQAIPPEATASRFCWSKLPPSSSR